MTRRDLRQLPDQALLNLSNQEANLTRRLSQVMDKAKMLASQLRMARHARATLERRRGKVEVADDA